ncbi:LRR receptor-like serine/threonine-protein kinase RGI1 [Linum perenne]
MIPSSFANLVYLSEFLLSENQISGTIPEFIGNFSGLKQLELDNNFFNGEVPYSIGKLSQLSLFYAWNNQLKGKIPEQLGNCVKLEALDLSHNFLTGSIPKSLFQLKNLSQLLLISNNMSGVIPPDIGNCHGLIRLRLGSNSFSGEIPPEIGILKNLSFLELSRNSFVGEIPQEKLNFSLHDIVTSLSDANVIGKGGSGMVYRVQTSTNQIVAVKKLWPVRNSSERDFFSAEVRALGSIRHKNIVRLLGCCKNGKTRLLLFDYISHGSLAGLLHEKEEFLDWEARYRILLGAAHGLAYLHHDCTPPIVHRDVKANNILVGQHFEAFLADFGIAKLVDSSAECSSGVSNSVAGSYGYIAPEYGYSLRITEKSDVYSYGVVLLEILTGKQPTDSQIPEGAHIVNWVNKELREKRREFTTVLDQQLVIRSGTQLQEMVQVLGVALLCVNPSPGERPTMKDVAAMLKEIKDSSNDTDSEKSSCGRRVGSDAKGGVQCSSFSRSSEALIRSP